MRTRGLKEMAGGSRTLQSESFRHENPGLKSECGPVKGRERVESHSEAFGAAFLLNLDAYRAATVPRKGGLSRGTYLYRHMC